MEAKTTGLFKQFPKPVTKACSTLFIQRLIGLSISTITWARKLFPTDCYKNNYVDGLPIKLLRGGNEESRKVLLWLRSSFEAIEKEYLKQVIFAIHEGSANGPVLETYSFTVKYTNESDDLECYFEDKCSGLKGGFTSDSNKDMSEALHKSTISLLRSCLLLKKGFTPLPQNRVITMKLFYYNDVTPPTYEPAGFRAATDTDFVYAAERAPKKLTLGQVTTKFHKAKCQIRSVFYNPSELSEMEYVNSTDEGSECLSPVNSVRRKNLWALKSKSPVSVVRNQDLALQKNYENSSNANYSSALYDKNGFLDNSEQINDTPLNYRNVQRKSILRDSNRNNYTLPSNRRSPHHVPLFKVPGQNDTLHSNYTNVQYCTLDNVSMVNCDTYLDPYEISNVPTINNNFHAGNSLMVMDKVAENVSLRSNDSIQQDSGQNIKSPVLINDPCTSNFVAGNSHIAAENMLEHSDLRNKQICVQTAKQSTIREHESFSLNNTPIDYNTMNPEEGTRTQNLQETTENLSPVISRMSHNKGGNRSNGKIKEHLTRNRKRKLENPIDTGTLSTTGKPSAAKDSKLTLEKRLTDKETVLTPEKISSAKETAFTKKLSKFIETALSSEKFSANKTNVLTHGKFRPTEGTVLSTEKCFAAEENVFTKKSFEANNSVQGVEKPSDTNKVLSAEKVCEPKENVLATEKPVIKESSATTGKHFYNKCSDSDEMIVTVPESFSVSEKVNTENHVRGLISSSSENNSQESVIPKRVKASLSLRDDQVVPNATENDAYIVNSNSLENCSAKKKNTSAKSSVANPVTDETDFQNSKSVQEKENIIDKTILCECKDVEERGLMLACAYCKTWQHAVCYGVLSDNYFGTHCCVDCALKDKSRQCTDLNLLPLNKPKLAAKCNYRRTLILCKNLDFVSQKDFTEKLNLNFNTSNSLISILQQRNVLPKGSNMEKMEINKRVLMEILIPKEFCLIVLQDRQM